MIDLSKGSCINLEKKVQDGKVLFETGWNHKRSVDLDSTASFFNKKGEMIQFIFFGKLAYRNKETGKIACELQGDDTTGGGEDGDANEEMDIILSNLPSDVDSFTMCLSIYSGISSLSILKNVFARIHYDGKAMFNMVLDPPANTGGIIIGTFSRKDDGWEYANESKYIRGSYPDISLVNTKEELFKLADPVKKEKSFNLAGSVKKLSIYDRIINFFK